MHHEISQSLLDALNACQAIQEFTQGQTFEHYLENKLLRSGVERQFEILGEAFNRIDLINPSFRDNVPGMGAVIGMRNRIIHGYDAVDDSIIWDAVQRHVPSLIAVLEKLQ
jgi:uncharacterized protein with HEPN domain